MADPRESILARLTVVLSGVSGVETAARNLDEVGDVRTPAIVLYDGDEEAAENNSAKGAAPTVVYMHPLVCLSLGDTPEAVGTTVNLFRARILKAVLTDTQLATICGTNGGVRYVGSQNLLSPGRAAQAQLTINLEISYPFKPLTL